MIDHKSIMGSNRTFTDEDVAAQLLWQMKAIATKEVESLPVACKQTFLDDAFFLTHDSDGDSSSSCSSGRKRTVSAESVEMMVTSTSLSPFKILSGPTSNVQDQTQDAVDHHDWSNRSDSSATLQERSPGEGSGLTIQKSIESPTLVATPGQRYGKRKRESFVGQTAKSGVVRATLKKKFSWKNYPELEGYLLENQEEYFEYSSKNYTAEQRKYNNDLTRGLLDLASNEGYVFEEFTFSMIRDRIRCYYKSHSQAAKKKRKK